MKAVAPKVELVLHDNYEGCKSDLLVSEYVFGVPFDLDAAP